MTDASEVHRRMAARYNQATIIARKVANLRSQGLSDRAALFEAELLRRLADDATLDGLEALAREGTKP